MSVSREKAPPTQRAIDAAERLRYAIKFYELHTGEDLNWMELGRRVAKLLGRTPLPSATLSRWKAGTQEPSADEYEKIGEVLGADPGWLVFGKSSQAPSPDQVEKGREPAPKAKQSPRAPVKR